MLVLSCRWCDRQGDCISISMTEKSLLASPFLGVIKYIMRLPDLCKVSSVVTKEFKEIKAAGQLRVAVIHTR